MAMKRCLLFIVLPGLSADCTAHDYCQAPFPTVESYTRPAGMSLRHVSVVLRHGDRTPIEPLSSHLDNWGALIDPATLQDQQFPFRGYEGLLTRTGQDQHIRLGASLREIYDEFLPNPYLGGLRVRCTHFSRTFQSARSFLRGLYPVNADVIPVEVQHTVPILVENRQDCPRLTQLVKRHQSNALYKHLQQEMQRLQQQMHTSMSFFNLADNHFCRKCHDRVVEDEEICRVSRDAFRFLLQHSAQDRELAKLQTGSTISALLAQLTTSDSMDIFAAHDSTIAYLHSSLQTGHYEWPPYAANMLFEVWQQTESVPADSESPSFVRVLYNGKTIALPWCQSDQQLCPLHIFVQFLSTLVPTNFRSECQPCIYGEPF
ncbi:hypothetical protein PSACC_01997 [Paramicrosporidium saccamoebae]|uniref:Acid phosphatase n=1 Tax=Paramicrosporidium saccamoebae TaxID=1246581 RepID=A0A2H9TK90_9FUNG|nr:hypothetical protein PSACC_01997 [Paramicrosporidium saccamoebae]